MIFDDDLDPRTKKPKRRALDAMSVPELKEYLQALRDEIVRVEADILRKERHKASVDSLFKK